MSNRITEVRLLSVPLEKDYEHTFWFNNKSEQENTMNSFVVEDINGKQIKYTNFSYQRKDNVIRWPEHFDNIAGCNYVMYRNEAYTNKWFYAFITDMKYVNDERTDITIETDVLQTYMFDYNLGPCFIERQHVNDVDWEGNEIIGAHTIPEGLETGEYVCNSVRKYNGFSNVMVILATTVDLSRIGSDSGDAGWRFLPPEKFSKYNGILSGVKYYAFHNNYDASSISKAPTLTDLSLLLELLASIGQSDAVVSLFLAPSGLIDLSTTIITIDDTKITWNDFKGEVYHLQEVENVAEQDTSNTDGDDIGDYSTTVGWGSSNDVVFPFPDTLDTYTPKNKKLLTYPYTYLYMDNNAGGANIYKYEYFKRDQYPYIVSFKIKGAITPGFSCRLLPFYYKGVSGVNNAEGLTAGKLPICNWITDVYTNWLTQQSINEKYDVLGHVLGAGSQVGSGAAMMGGYGALAGGISWTGQGIEKIFDNVKQREIHKQIPPTLNGNINAGDVNFSGNNLTFTGYQMSIKKEYAQIIDMYFNMYGYQVNIVDVPLKKHRENYWYTKTSGANIIHNGMAPIPQSDIDKIRSIYDHGVTFWTSTLNFLDYTIDNPIISTTKEG